MLEPAATYEALIARFRWSLPARYNIAEVCCDAWAARDADRVALLRYTPGTPLAPTTYGDLKRLSDRLAAALAARGIGRGDRVALLLPQSVETVVGHLAVYKLGAVAVPLAALFGADALRFRLTAAGARAIITDAAGLTKVRPLAGALPELTTLISTDGADGSAIGYADLLADTAPAITVAATTPDDPAMMIFTSGTTGAPKGALHGHRVLAGHMPGIAYTHEFLPRPGDRLWTPSDWAWAGGLLNCLLPGLAYGVPVVFGPFVRFDPDAAVALMADAEVRNAFLPPTALRMMRAAGTRLRPGHRLRTIGSAGESLGRETYEWARADLGVTVNEFYGQTECNYVLGSSAALGVTRAGAIGKAVPGHAVAIVDGQGNVLPSGETGEIAIRRGDPAMFLEYWRDQEATAGKFIGDWMLTGDLGTRDGEDYVHFLGRNDDVIISSGYRIGPSEIEDCLATHPAVALAAAVGKPDPLRTEIVKAYVKLKPGFAARRELADDIRRHVRDRLSAAEYPREIEFVDDIPLTTSGKVIRRFFRNKESD